MKQSLKQPSMTNGSIQNLYAKIAKRITSSLEANEIISAVMEQIELFFQPRNWSLLLVDPVTKELFFVIAKGADSSLMRNVRLKPGEGVAGHVAQDRQSLLIVDVQKDKHFSAKLDLLTGFKTRSLIAVPIIFQDQVLGVIELVNAFDDRRFTRRELAMLETIADFSAIALVNARMYERISWIAVHDPLTKVYNRSHLEKIINF